MADETQVPTLAEIYRAKLDIRDINTFTTSTALTFVDADGVTKKTLAGLVANTGWFAASGSFEVGGTITERNQYLHLVTTVGGDVAGGYSWGGALPKVVPPGSTPATTGGTPEDGTGWVYRGETTVRAALADGSADIAGKTASDLVSQSFKSKYNYAMMGRGFASTDGAGDPFASWTHATVAYDADTDDFVVIYNTSSGHAIEFNSVLLRKKKTDSDAFTAASIVASDKGNFTYKCQAFGIAANGDYVALVAKSVWGTSSFPETFIYRSTDKGVSWTSSLMQSGGVNVTSFNGDVSGFLVTLSGRILTFAVAPSPSFLSRIFYSDDNGATWQQSTIAGSPTDVTEPAWCDLGGGNLVCIARAAVRFGGTTEKIPAKFMTSSDNGATWSAPVDSASITNFTLSNGEMIPDYDTRTIEFIHHSRFTEADNFSSLLVSRASFDDALIDNFSTQVRIGKLAAYTAIGTTSGDSGYVGAKRAANGVINAFFYTGTRLAAQISYLVGNPDTAYANNDRTIDPVTGQVVSFEDTPFTKTPFTKTPILLNNKLNSKLPTPFGVGFTQGTARLNQDSAVLTITGADGVNLRRSSIRTLRKIDFSKVDKVILSISSMTGNDVGLALYDDTFNTGNPLTGRKFFNATDKVGEFVCDVTAISGIYSLQVVLNSVTNASATIDAITLIKNDGNFDITEVGFDKVAFRNGFGRIGGGSLVAGFSFGNGTGTQDLTGNFIRIGATFGTTATNRSFRFTDPLPAGTRCVTCRVSYNVDVDSQAFDAGIAVFNKLNPTAAFDGRVAFNYMKGTGGMAQIFIPDANAGDTLYLHLVANATAAGASADAYFDEVICYK